MTIGKKKWTFHNITDFFNKVSFYKKRKIKGGVGSEKEEEETVAYEETQEADQTKIK